jgi:hypothetical protein
MIKTHRTQLSISNIDGSNVQCLVSGFPDRYKTFPAKWLSFEPTIGKIFHARVGYDISQHIFVLTSVEKD